MSRRDEWLRDQDWERNSWGNDLNFNHGEAKKQLHYAKLLGIDLPHNANGKSIIDFGCGPIGMLLRTSNFSRAVGLEPLNYGDDITKRYQEHGIDLLQIPIEDYDLKETFDEAWMYNVLEHVIDPVECLNKIKNVSRILRVFEWIDIPPSPGHPHTITKSMIIDNLQLKDNEWKIVELNQEGLVGKAIVVLRGV